MRIFIAFPVPETVQFEATKVAKLVQLKHPEIEGKWAAKENMHVTLEFLGSVTEKQLQTVRECLLYQTKKASPFLYHFTALAAFPNVHRPSIVVLTVGEVETAFSMLLRKAVHEELSLYNLSRDFKLWRPHITLVRIKNPEKISAVDIATVPLPKIEWKIAHLDLIESKLTTHGAEYSVLERFPLG